MSETDGKSRVAVDRSTATQVVARLRQEKYVQEESQPTKKGGKNRGSQRAAVKRGLLIAYR